MSRKNPSPQEQHPYAASQKAEQAVHPNSMDSQGMLAVVMQPFDRSEKLDNEQGGKVQSN
jgi:hypothetical protein